MPGPLEDPRARRRLRNGPPVTRLPAEGRHGPTPEWPLSEASAEELEIWTALWQTPQSAAWPPGWTRTQARLARMLAEAEKPGARASLLSEVRQAEAALGLSPSVWLASIGGLRPRSRQRSRRLRSGPADG